MKIKMLKDHMGTLLHSTHAEMLSEGHSYDVTDECGKKLVEDNFAEKGQGGKNSEKDDEDDGEVSEGKKL